MRLTHPPTFPLHDFYYNKVRTTQSDGQPIEEWTEVSHPHSRRASGEAGISCESGATSVTVTASTDSLYRTQPTSPGSACGAMPRGSQPACVEADHMICDLPKYFVFLVSTTSASSCSKAPCQYSCPHSLFLRQRPPSRHQQDRQKADDFG